MNSKKLSGWPRHQLDMGHQLHTERCGKPVKQWKLNGNVGKSHRTRAYLLIRAAKRLFFLENPCYGRNLLKQLSPVTWRLALLVGPTWCICSSCRCSFLFAKSAIFAPKKAPLITRLDTEMHDAGSVEGERASKYNMNDFPVRNWTWSFAGPEALRWVAGRVSPLWFLEEAPMQTDAFLQKRKSACEKLGCPNWCQLIHVPNWWCLYIPAVFCTLRS